mmetsp:Transcript_6365/g.20685  ORF Transcript_6365/g.20685 Transcript_6365/m.20685 type:complete len:117 (-) Transcript_6365:757-1107(-)
MRPADRGEHPPRGAIPVATAAGRVGEQDEEEHGDDDDDDEDVSLLDQLLAQSKAPPRPRRATPRSPLHSAMAAVRAVHDSVDETPASRSTPSSSATPDAAPPGKVAVSLAALLDDF